MTLVNFTQKVLAKASDTFAKKVVTPLHQRSVSGRRVSRLSQLLTTMLIPHELLSGLDVGCGSGEVAMAMTSLDPKLILKGVEVLVREDAVLNITCFDGKTLPFADKSFDFTLLIDVLHHTDVPLQLLSECVRVSRRNVLIKDHFCNSQWDRLRLRFMDWVGNRGHNVYLPFNYQSEQNWQELYAAAKIVPEQQVTALHLYPQPFSLLFDDHLHFMARLKIQ